MRIEASRPTRFRTRIIVVSRTLDAAGINEIRFAKTPAEAVDLALSLAPGGETGKTIEREFRS
jgi:hypothetical protein